jgi:hypothetical protein
MGSVSLTIRTLSVATDGKHNGMMTKAGANSKAFTVMDVGGKPRPIKGQRFHEFALFRPFNFLIGG